MSIWTHAAGIVVFNDFGDPAIENYDKLDVIFGKQWDWHSSRKTKEDARYDSMTYMPSGSEGSLKKFLNKTSSNISVLSIQGDLRDYSSPEKIIEWFRGSVKNLDESYLVRQAVITVQCELNDDPITYVYSSDDE